MTELFRRVNSSSALAPIALCIAAFAFGFVCIVVAAWRAGLVPVVAPVLAFGAFAVEAANVHSVVGGAVKETLGLVALGWIGVKVLRMEDDGWSAGLA